MLKQEQIALTSKLNHMSEILENQLVKMDKKIDTVFDTVTQASSILNSMLEGDPDYPKLYVIIPVPRNTTLVGRKSSLHLWYQAIEDMYNNPKLLYCDDCSVRLYPLCAYSMEPVGEGIEILHPKRQLKEMSFALQLSASILSSLALYSTAVSMLIPALNTSIQSSLRYVTALQLSLSLSDAPGVTAISNDLSSPESTVSSCIPLDPIQAEIFAQIEFGYQNGEDIHTVLGKITPLQYSQIKPVANESYRMIRNILDHVDPGLHHLRTLMSPCANIHTNEIHWVKIDHVKDWKYASLQPVSKACESHKTQVSVTRSSNILEPIASPLLSHIDNVPEIVEYDPWVLVHPPHISSQDCDDVERLSQWIQSEVHLLHSTSDYIATCLVTDNCPHIERLKTRLIREPQYLQSVGVSEEDADDIKSALFGIEHRPAMRAWCILS